MTIYSELSLNVKRFVELEHRGRMLSVLALESEKGLASFTEELNVGFGLHLDQRFASTIEADADIICGKIKANTRTIYCNYITYLLAIGNRVEIREAIQKTLAMPYGVLVTIVPGEMAFYKDEDQLCYLLRHKMDNK